MAEDERTAEDVVRDERCAIPTNIQQDLRVLAKVSNKTLCEMTELAISEFVGRQKAKSDCHEGILRNERLCKCLEDT
ncbi:MAG: hypothetical protein WBZ36_26130 [Candidatus Nitrosopolaris sp.]